MREGWTETTLGEAAIVNPQLPALDAAAPFAPMDAVHVGRRYVTYFEPRGQRSGARASSGDVLFARITPCLENGKVAQVPDGVGPCGGSTEFIVIRGSDKMTADFAYYWATSSSTRDTATGLMTGTTGRQRLSWQDLARITVYLPPISEQSRIVDLMSSVDSYVAALQQQADAARSARSAVLSELLSAGGDDWTETTVCDLLSRSIGGVWGTEPGTDQEEVTVVRSTEFTKSGILNFATGVPRSIKSSQLSSRTLAEGDILLEKSGGGPEQPVGRVVYVQADIPPRFVCSNFIQLLTPIRQRVVPRFLFLVMWLWHFQNKTLEYQAQTTGIRNLRTPAYLDQFIALPPLVEQERIVEIVSSIDDVIQSADQAVADAKSLRSGLLSDLLSGAHEIPGSYDRLLGAA